MRPSESAEELRRFFRQNDIALNTATLRQWVEALLLFYQTVPTTDLFDSPQSDMLLFQYGTYDWGDGEHFEFDITRQFVEAEDESDNGYVISQLHCRALYQPTDFLRAIGEANLWCSNKDEVSTFRSAIMESSAYIFLQQHRSRDVIVAWEQV
jgi:hypothetical protein